jgi:hypothetical protein
MMRNNNFHTVIARYGRKFKWTILDRIGHGLLGSGMESTRTESKKAARRFRDDLIAKMPQLKLNALKQGYR